jgi:hypothetical protein
MNMLEALELAEPTNRHYANAREIKDPLSLQLAGVLAAMSLADLKPGGKKHSHRT